LFTGSSWYGLKHQVRDLFVFLTHESTGQCYIVASVVEKGAHPIKIVNSEITEKTREAKIKIVLWPTTGQQQKTSKNGTEAEQSRGGIGDLPWEKIIESGGQEVA
jgi:hypothetical protein